MFKHLGTITSLTTFFMLYLNYGQILANNYYTINEGYPISVRRYHEPHTRVDLKRSTKYDDFFHNNKTQYQKVAKHRSCIKCPGDITAIARKGLDGVLVDLPQPVSCKTNLPFSRNLFRAETLFGPEVSFVLPQGRHGFIAKIRNVESGLIIRSCHLKYNVIVRHCHGLPQLKNKNVKLSCTAGKIWGSKCAFECKNVEENLSHYEPIVCNDDLEWEGQEPECVSDNDNSLLHVEDETFCTHPTPPENGRFVCEPTIHKYNEQISEMNLNSIENYKTLAPRTLCYIHCNRLYSIPFRLLKFSRIQCANGVWNSTNIDFCYKKTPQRRHLFRRCRKERQRHLETLEQSLNRS